MKQNRTELEVASVYDIQPYEHNPRINTEAVPVLSKSIHDFGFMVPIVLDKDDVIVTGHTRAKACIKLLEEGDLGLWGDPPKGCSPEEAKRYQRLAPNVYCIRAENLTPEEIKAYRLADNKTAELAGWDFGMLDEELEELKDDFDMEDYGFILEDFDDEDFDDEEDIMSDETPVRETSPRDKGDHEPVADPRFVIEPGDLVRMGRHTLVCAPSDSEEALDILLDGDRPDMAFSEPAQALLPRLSAWLDAVLPRVAVAVAAFPLGEQQKQAFVSLLADHADSFKTMIYRGRPQDLKSPGRLMPSVDPVPVFSSTDVSDVFPHDPGTWTGFVDCRDVWTSQFAKAVISALTPEEGVVLDCFGGMGYTLEACEALGRTCLILEDNPVYCSALVAKFADIGGVGEDISVEHNAVGP